MAEKTPTVVKWKIHNLKEHPQQATMFGDIDESELDALTENMEKQGLRIPIEILPDGTIITGHQRVRAAKRLNWKEIAAVVRHDLAAQGEAAVETHFVEDNFERRQLSPLARAKCIRRLMELEVGKNDFSYDVKNKEALKSRVAKRMKLSLRSVNRYLLLLDTPHVIQEAFERGELPLTLAGKVALLPKYTQKELTQRIEAGDKLVQVVRELTQKNSNANQTMEAKRAFKRFLAALQRELPKFQEQLEQINTRLLREATPIAKETVVVLKKVIALGSQKTTDVEVAQLRDNLQPRKHA